MKNKNKDRSPEDSKAIHQEFQTSEKKPKQGGTNSIFPQEYEEQLGTDIRMKPQPFGKPKKRRG